jgi:hypothetical protein
VAVLLPQAVVTPGRIDATQVTQCWTALHRLEELDALHGSAAVYQVAEGAARQLQDALRQESYSPAVGRELQGVTAAAMEQAGWIAYDAGWQRKARYWWLETCHLTDLSDVPDAHVTALASMSLQASNTPGGGREAVDLAQASRAAAHDQASPTLLSLLSAREPSGTPKQVITPPPSLPSASPGSGSTRDDEEMSPSGWISGVQQIPRVTKPGGHWSAGRVSPLS